MTTNQRTISGLCLCLVLSFSACSQKEEEFKLVACWVVPESSGSVALVFKDPSGHTRRITFMDSYKEFALKTDRMKGLLQWDKTIAVHLKRSGDDGKILSIEYRYPEDKNSRVFEGGLIDSGCEQTIRARYGGSLRFVED